MKKIISFFTLAAALLLTGCQTDVEPYSTTVFAMDTAMEITVYGDEKLLPQTEELILSLENKLSVTDDNSEIAEINRNKSGKISAETADLLSKTLDLCEDTDGALDISVYPIVREWGFTTGDHHVPSEEKITELLRSVNYKNIELNGGKVTLPPNTQIDLGSVAKGYTGDKLIEFLRENGVKSALLNLGGNVQALGSKPDGSPWKIAVTDPNGNGYAGAVEVRDKAVITSGGYERYFESDNKIYHHIIDPRTGYPADSGLLSVTVVGENGLVCDGLSTALFVMGLDKAAELWRDRNDFEAIFITEDGITITSGLQSDFSPMGIYQNKELAVINR